ncbi:glycine--tRNA ligase beta subunit [Litorimonas cladophorae]|uniref:Glycine--tRNA ligase beta subunit n=1 Tax=Litorimonas cladophorae TaxID=1220491 RepID=A0A918KJA0_9PROT|nr:glycine--tRNA ligase subunit beta [Litorimonas cladophorae]GGX63842.1 glycine--tRNA ligase beta subunit [Litorimonas cladophorae]
MAEFLFEILSEEIPARMQVRAGADLQKLMVAGLTKAGLTVENIRVLTGPRRLTFVADLPVRSPDVTDIRKGPRVGSPERALEGFLKAAGLSDISEAETRTDPKKGEYYVAVIQNSGQDTRAILQALIPDVMANFPWPKSMKSGGSNFRWVRPLRGLLVLFQMEVVHLEVGGITSSNTTIGHRRHGPGPYAVSTFENYRSQLEQAGHVMLSHEDRKAVILSNASELCADKGLELVEDEGLLNEVAGLTEWPVVLFGDMDADFLNLPDEVIRLTLKSHQKTFTVRDPKTGKLAAHYIIVANQIAPDGGEAIKAGNGKVISARLSDAVFFQTEDAKKNLIDYYEKLDTVVFHKKLGTIKDKAERVAALARDLAAKVDADPDLAEQAAKLAKCDLVTQTVIEATSLQGQIGRLMFEREGGNASVATAIEEHYKPQGPSDDVPTDPVAIAVALADKLDTLVGFWAIDEKPTGSKDPFALRRAALGVVRIILENDVRISLIDVTIKHLIQLKMQLSQNKAATGWADSKSRTDSRENTVVIQKLLVEIDTLKTLLDGSPSREFENSDVVLVIPSLLTFILDRLKVYLRDQGMGHDIIDAALTEGQDDLVAIVNRVNALQSFLSTPEGEDLLAGYKRAANILKAEAKKGELPSGAANRPSDEQGAALFDALTAAKPAISKALESEDYAKALTSLAGLRIPIDAFFTDTQIISDDTAVKDNNLRLLGMISDTSRQIADFEAIQG